MSSTTPGYLQPTNTPLPGGLSLERYIQQFIVGLTGIPGNMVRPRFQTEPGKQPSQPEDQWCSFSISESEPDANAYLNQNDENMSLERHVILTLFCSFYGSNSFADAERFRDGLEIAQNRDALTIASMGLVRTERILFVPEIVNNRWFKRSDITIYIRRRIKRTYEVLPYTSSNGEVIAEQNNDETLTTSFNVEE